MRASSDQGNSAGHDSNFTLGERDIESRRRTSATKLARSSISSVIPADCSTKMDRTAQPIFGSPWSVRGRRDGPRSPDKRAQAGARDGQGRRLGRYKRRSGKREIHCLEGRPPQAYGLTVDQGRQCDHAPETSRSPAGSSPPVPPTSRSGTMAGSRTSRTSTASYLLPARRLGDTFGDVGRVRDTSRKSRATHAERHDAIGVKVRKRGTNNAKWSTRSRRPLHAN